MFKSEYIIFIFAFVVSYFGIRWFRIWTLQRGYLDHPNERSSHDTPTPRGGGLVIAGITLATYICCSWLFDYRISVGFLFGGFLIVAISWLDDIFSLSFIWRVLIHAIAAVCVIGDLGYFTTISLPLPETTLYVGIAGSALAFIWIVGLVNAYNFMDGIDGIAGIQSVAASVGWLIVGSQSGMSNVTILSGTVLFSSIGFLLHNWQPAKIFMGDVGSAFLGFTFATIPFLLREHVGERSSILPLAAVLFVWLFVFDSALTLLRRLIRGERIWTAHRKHLYQRLVIAGCSHQFVSLFYGLIAMTIALTTSFLLFIQLADSTYIISALVLVLTSILIVSVVRIGR